VIPGPDIETLWEHTDRDGDRAYLETTDLPDAFAFFAVLGAQGSGDMGAYLSRPAAIALREALDRLLADQPAPGPTQVQEVAAQVEANADALEDNLRHRAQDFACRDAYALTNDVRLLALELRRLAHALAGGAS
jgi:hypothetical protein